MIDSAHLQGRDRYERVMEGRVDNTHPDALTHTAHLRDDDVAIELSAVATPTPTYEIRELRCRVVSGAADPALADAVGALAGARMVAGFTRRVSEAVEGVAGGGHVVDAAIEIARLARQVAKLPPERAGRAAEGDPWECWQLDTTGWIDLPNSCFTYSEAGRKLFGTREVRTALRPDLYAPPPGAMGVFQRRKVARLERRPSRLMLFHSMHDDAHAFEITYEVDLDSGRVVRADALTPRLPYMGICTEPQKKIVSLVGESLDPDFRKRIQTLIGGSAGCAQLYDLTADLLKLLQLG